MAIGRPAEPPLPTQCALAPLGIAQPSHQIALFTLRASCKGPIVALCTSVDNFLQLHHQLIPFHICNPKFVSPSSNLDQTPVHYPPVAPNKP